MTDPRIDEAANALADANAALRAAESMLAVTGNAILVELGITGSEYTGSLYYGAPHRWRIGECVVSYGRLRVRATVVKKDGSLGQQQTLAPFAEIMEKLGGKS